MALKYSTKFESLYMLNGIDLVEEVCYTSYRFLQSIYDKKKMMRNAIQIVVKEYIDNINDCKTLCHKKI